MQRPTATSLLLLASGLARAVSLVLAEPSGGGIDLAAAAVGVDVVVPLAIAVADVRGHRAAPTAAVTFGALGAGRLMTNGLAALDRAVPLDAPLVAFLAAAGLAALAAATAIARWQDHGAPAAGDGPRLLRAAALLAGGVLALTLVTTSVAIIGAVSLEIGVLPGPVAIATTVSLRRLPLLAGALLPLAWSAARADPDHLRAASLVLGARAVVEVVADAALLALGGPVWPIAVLAAVAVVLLVVVPVGVQVTSSRA